MRLMNRWHGVHHGDMIFHQLRSLLGKQRFHSVCDTFTVPADREVILGLHQPSHDSWAFYDERDRRRFYPNIQDFSLSLPQEKHCQGLTTRPACTQLATLEATIQMAVFTFITMQHCTVLCITLRNDLRPLYEAKPTCNPHTIYNRNSTVSTLTAVADPAASCCNCMSLADAESGQDIENDCVRSV